MGCVTQPVARAGVTETRNRFQVRFTQQQSAPFFRVGEVVSYVFGNGKAHIFRRVGTEDHVYALEPVLRTCLDVKYVAHPKEYGLTTAFVLLSYNVYVLRE